jgi:hypothetical protein
MYSTLQSRPPTLVQRLGREKNRDPSLLDQRLSSAHPQGTIFWAATHGMSAFEALTLAFEDWFDTPLCDLPAPLRQRVEQEFFPMPWDTLSASQRRSVSLQLDYRLDPATQQGQKFWWDFFERVDELKKEVAEWETVAAPTAAELALKEARLTELKQKLSHMDARMRQARGDHYPEIRPNQSSEDTPSMQLPLTTRYLAYPKAMHLLAKRLGATPAELAGWIFCGPKDGGIAAYMNANELDPPPRFYYAADGNSQDYIAPLMACWFKEDDVDRFEPAERYITGAALIARWGQLPELHAEAFVLAKIVESRLFDIHPICGLTRGTSLERLDQPSLESGLFSLADVVKIEMEDFDVDVDTGILTDADVAASPVPPEKAELGSPEWRTQNAKAAANALHDKPGGSRDKQRQIREIWASGKYSARDLCAEQECAALNMSFSAARNALRNIPKTSRC